MNWSADLEAICRPDVPLSEHTWYGLGGPARWMFTPRDEPELRAVLAACAERGVTWRVLGRGANVLVRDAGFDGAVIRLIGRHWEDLTVDNERVHAGAGLDFQKLVRQTVDAGLLGLEGLAGIPGTVGGALRMNAGGRYGNVGTCAVAVQVLTPAGAAETWQADRLEFGYRTSNLRGVVILGATLVLAPGDAAAGLARFREVWQEKAAQQPPVAARSAGCIFKNPPGQAAGALLDRAGLKGVRRGGAEISTRHANFILAHPGATAQDVLDLIALGRERVHETAGIELETEVEIW